MADPPRDACVARVDINNPNLPRKLHLFSSCKVLFFMQRSFTKEGLLNMKRIATICFILILAALVLVSSDAFAQTIKINAVGRSLNQTPGAKWSISNGLRVVGVGSKVFLKADTAGSGVTGAPTWSFAAALPGGSTTVLDSTGLLQTSFTADVAGFYYLSVTVGTATARDTVYASTYGGVASAPDAGCSCHTGGFFAPGNATTIKTAWEASNHATIFKRGVTGNLEVIAEINKGLYAKNCIQCHTTGWDVNLNNGNFGYLAHTLPLASPNSWDSTWFAGLPWTADGRDVMITTGDMTIWNAVPAAMLPVATIGCESCHGPMTGHKTGGGVGNFRQTVDKTMDAAVCNQCHDGSGRHSIGTYARAAAHSNKVLEARVGCAPCHQGAPFVKWVKAGHDTTGFTASVTTEMLNTPITCATCHEPHTGHLREASVDSLRNGFQFTPAGKSQICSYCHSARYSVKTRVTTKAPYFGFVNRFYPHYNMQYDMLVGSNGYQYGDEGFTGVSTHMGLEDGCVTCHMQGRVRSNNTLSNHSMSMTDTTFGFKGITVCKTCHGEIEDFDDVKAAYDYDADGQIEGVQTEIHGLLDRLKARLPIDASTGEPVQMLKDSLLVKNRPDYIQGIWNYYFVKYDGSYGVHNTKYAVALLQKALGTYPLDVKAADNTIPTEFALGQNFPNPFNPSTTINFALPQQVQVKLEVYDILGNLVKTMVNQEMGAGTYNVVWNGVDRNGVKVASGMYLYRLQAGSFSTVKKMLMVK
jgi:hypothetical protein